MSLVAGSPRKVIKVSGWPIGAQVKTVGKSSVLKLLLMRHGESVSNRDRRMTGREDSPLTALGRQQCQQLAAWLYQQDGRPSHLYSSPLRRSLESVAELLTPWQWRLPLPMSPAVESTGRGVGDRPSSSTVALTALGSAQPPPLTLSPHLQEFDAGILTGLTWAAAQQRYPDLCHALMASADWVPIPEAETPLQGRQRAQQFIHHLLQVHGNGDTVWVMSHQWILEHLIAALLGCDRTWQMAMPNTALFEFWLDRDRWEQPGMSVSISDLWQIQRFGERPHLSNG